MREKWRYWMVLLGVGCSEYELTPIGDLNLQEENVDTGLRWFDGGFIDQDDSLSSNELFNPFPQAIAPIYLHTGVSLWSWTPGEEDPILIGEFFGDFGFRDGMTDIAISQRGGLFGCSNESLFAINPLNAETLKIATLPDWIWGLTFIRGGRLVGSGSGIYVIDPINGTFADVLFAPNGLDQTSGDLVELPDGLLYWTTLAGDHDGLLVVDPEAGEIVDRQRAPTSGIWGVAYVQETLYGFDFEGNFMRLDLSGGGEIFDQDQPVGWGGAAGNPIFE